MISIRDEPEGRGTVWSGERIKGQRWGWGRQGLGLLARLTLVQWGWHAALHPWGVVIHDVDSDVGVPV